MTMRAQRERACRCTEINDVEVLHKGRGVRRHVLLHEVCERQLDVGLAPYSLADVVQHLENLSLCSRMHPPISGTHKAPQGHAHACTLFLVVGAGLASLERTGTRKDATAPSTAAASLTVANLNSTRSSSWTPKVDDDSASH